MKIFLESDTQNVLVVSEANEHPFPSLGECLVIKFIKENDNKYYLDKDGMNGLMAYINYLVKDE
jgi:hypothetical protein